MVIDIWSIQERESAIVSGLEAILELQSKERFPKDVSKESIENYLDVLRQENPADHYAFYNKILKYCKANLEAYEGTNQFYPKRTFTKAIYSVLALPHIPISYLLRRKEKIAFYAAIVTGWTAFSAGLIGGLEMGGLLGATLVAYTFASYSLLLPDAVGEAIDWIASLKFPELMEIKKRKLSIMFRYTETTTIAETAAAYFLKKGEEHLQGKEDAGQIRLLQADVQCLKDFLE